MFYKAVVVVKDFYKQCVLNNCIDESTGKLLYQCNENELYCKYAQFISYSVSELYNKLNNYLIDIGQSEKNVLIFISTVKEV